MNLLASDIIQKPKTDNNWRSYSNWPSSRDNVINSFRYSQKTENRSKTRIHNLPVQELKIEINSCIIGVLPQSLKGLFIEIQESKYILSLQDNWDDEGSKAYNVNTWIKAITFLTKIAKLAHNKMKYIIPTPKVYHGEDGSIDILWENDKFRFLINFPENNDQDSSFYGDNYGSQKIEGTLNSNYISTGIILALMEF